MSVDLQDVITCASFCDDLLTGLGVARGRISRFPIDLRRRPYNTLALPCECVIRIKSVTSSQLRFRPTRQNIVQQESTFLTHCHKVRSIWACQRDRTSREHGHCEWVHMSALRNNITPLVNSRADNVLVTIALEAESSVVSVQQRSGCLYGKHVP